MQNMQVFVSVKVTGLFLYVMLWAVSIWLLGSLCIVYTHVCVCVCGNDFLFAADVWVPVRSVSCFVQVERPQTVLE